MVSTNGDHDVVLDVRDLRMLPQSRFRFALPLGTSLKLEIHATEEAY